MTPVQYINACRVWGRPDVVHDRALWSNMGAIPARDIVIFGALAFNRRFKRTRRVDFQPKNKR
jgi:hypothetical protein